MKGKKTISILILISFLLTAMPKAKAAADEWTTHNCDEDLFVASYLFDDVDIVYLQGDEMQIRSWFWFEGPVLDARRHVSEAYLSVYCPAIGSTDPDASLTIYGKPSGKGGTPSYYDDPHEINGPYTTNAYTVNISSFVGPGWHNITVTNIIREINQGYYFWDGHDIAFVTLSTSDHDEERFCASEETGNAAILYVHYSEPSKPGGVPGDAEFVEEYRNHSIWVNVNEVNSTMSYKWNNMTGANEGHYHATYERGVIDNDDWDLIAEPGDYVESLPWMDTIVRLGDFIATLDDWGEPYLSYSFDDGATWQSVILQDQFTALAAHESFSLGSMSADENGTVHVTWGGYTPDFPAVHRQIYSNFTVLANGTINYFDGYTELGNAWTFENMEVDNYGRIHIFMIKTDGDAYYKIRFINGTWADDETILANTDSKLAPNVDVANQTGDYPMVRFVFSRYWVGVEDVYQTLRYPNGTLTHTLLKGTNTFYPVSANDIEGNCSWAVWQDVPGGVDSQIEMRGYNFTTETLLSEVHVSSQSESHKRPDIGIGLDNQGYVVWYSSWHLDCWGRRFDTETGSFTESRQRIVNTNTASEIKLTITPWNVAGYANTTFYIVDANGTLIDTYTVDEDNETAALEDLEDYVDTDVIGYPDPADPDPPGWEGGGLMTVHNFRLILFSIGMILFVGTPVFGFAVKPDGATWIAIMFCMLCGVSLLWALQSM